MSQRGGRGSESERPSVKGGHASASGQGKTSAAEIQTYLKGMDYPANSQDLVAKAHDNGAPQDVIHILEQMPKNKEFRSAAEVSQALSDVM